MNTAAFPASRYYPGVPQGGPVSPFMKSSNSEYGNWFKGPPGPFSLSNGVVTSNHFNMHNRKVPLRRTTSHLQDKKQSESSETSIITPLVTGSRQDGIVSNGTYRSSVRPNVGGLERSFSYSGEASPRETASKVDAEFSMLRSNMMERSSTLYDMTNHNSHDKSGLRRSRTFTEGTSHASTNPTWKSSSPRGYGQGLNHHSSFNSDSIYKSDNGHGPHLDRSTTGVTLPTVSSNSSTQYKIPDQKFHATYPGLSHRSQTQLQNGRQDVSSVTQDSNFSWLNSSAPRSSSVPLNGISSLKTYHGLLLDDIPSPVKSRFDNEDVTNYKSERGSDSPNPYLQDAVPSIAKQKATKSILKKKSAYEGTSNYLGYSRSVDDNFLRSWASGFTSFVTPSFQHPSLGQQNVAATVPVVTAVKPRNSSKKVTFDL